LPHTIDKRTRGIILPPAYDTISYATIHKRTGGIKLPPVGRGMYRGSRDRTETEVR
jgi:hypothetical protein